MILTPAAAAGRNAPGNELLRGPPMTVSSRRAGPAVRRVRHGGRLAHEHHRRLDAFGAEKGLKADWAAFADDWRGLYQPAMEEVRSGRRAWTILDVLHRESLDKLHRQIRDRAA